MQSLRENIQHVSFINIHTHRPCGSNDVFELINRIPLQGEDPSTDGWYSCGLHPWFISESTLTDSLSQIETLARQDNVIAIGETGLDKVCNTPFDLQTEVFERHIVLARQMNKPLIIHCVKAWSEILSLRKKNLKNPWIFHAFNANLEIAEELIDLGCYLSFGKSLFKIDSKAYKTLSGLKSLQQVFFETDDDEDFYIEDVYQKASAIRDTEMCTINKTTKDNFCSCFNIEI
jgi:TatD DNase family protein